MSTINQSNNKYIALEDIEISYMTQYAAPYTCGGHGRLFKGETIFIKNNSMIESSDFVYADPLNYEEVEKMVVPENELGHERYGGMVLIIKTIDLRDKFKKA